MRKILKIATAAVVVFFVFYSVVLNTAVFNAIGLCRYQPAEEECICMESCCSVIGTISDCCCYFSETPYQTDTIITYESFGKSIYNDMCEIHTYDKSDFNALYIVDYETQYINNNIVNKIFRPPKV